MQSETAKNYLQNLLKKAGAELGFGLDAATVSVPEAKFGDYATNAGLIAAKALKKNPKDIAEQIIVELKKLDGQKMFSVMEA